MDLTYHTNAMNLKAGNWELVCCHCKVSRKYNRISKRQALVNGLARQEAKARE
jgi:hypothetical protein